MSEEGISFNKRTAGVYKVFGIIMLMFHIPVLMFFPTTAVTYITLLKVRLIINTLMSLGKRHLAFCFKPPRI